MKIYCLSKEKWLPVHRAHLKIGNSFTQNRGKHSKVIYDPRHDLYMPDRAEYLKIILL